MLTLFYLLLGLATFAVLLAFTGAIDRWEAPEAAGVSAGRTAPRSGAFVDRRPRPAGTARRKASGRPAASEQEEADI